MQPQNRALQPTMLLRWPLRLLGLAGLWVLLTACDPSAMMLEVNTTADLPDADPGDGICEATPGVGDCTLRAAIMEANAVPKADTIDLGSGNIYFLTLAGTDEDGAATGDLDITESVTIKGASTVNGNGLDRVFDVHASTLLLNDARITGGATDGVGGGIRLNGNAGILTYQVEVSGNTAAGSGAGGVDAAGGTMRLVSTVVAENSGGVGGVRTAGQLYADNVTVSTNTGTSGTGGIAVAPGAPSGILNFSTITANTGGGYSGAGVFATSIVADQASGADCATAPASAGYNLDSDGSCLPIPTTGDLAGQDPLLLPLSSYGGPHRSHLVPPASPAIDQVPLGVLTCGGGSGAFDQRGMSRPSDTDLDGTVACEIGATENNDRIPGGQLEVDMYLGDVPAATAGDGRCEATPGGNDCTLRAALEEINTWPLGGNVFIYPGSDLVLTHGSSGERSLVIARDMVVIGTGQTIDGGDDSRVIYVDGATEPTVALRNLDLTGGNAKVWHAATGLGGGMLVDGPARVELLSATVTGNQSAQGGGGVAAQAGAELYLTGSEIAFNTTTGSGGGLRLDGGSTVRVTTTSIDGNAATTGGIGGGGGIAVFDSSLELARSSVVANAAAQNGGGIWTAGPATTLAIEHATISSNSAQNASAIICFNSPALGTLRYTTVVDNDTVAGTRAITCNGLTAEASILGAQASGTTCTGLPLVSLGYNVETASDCGLTDPTDAQHTDPELDPLFGLSNGTLGHPLLATSPVIDFIPAGAAGCGTTDEIDQQSVLLNRPTGGGCEPGALEYQP